MATIQELQLLNNSAGDLSRTLLQNRMMKEDKRRAGVRENLDAEMFRQRNAEREEDEAGRSTDRVERALHTNKMEEHSGVANKLKTDDLKWRREADAFDGMRKVYEFLNDGVGKGSINPAAASRRTRELQLKAQRIPELIKSGQLKPEEAMDAYQRAIQEALSGDDDLFQEPPLRTQYPGSASVQDLGLAEQYRARAKQAEASGDKAGAERLIAIAAGLERKSGRADPSQFDEVTTTEFDKNDRPSKSTKSRIPAGSAPPEVTPGAEATMPTLTPAAASPGSSKETAVAVKTRADVEALAPGAWFINPADGKPMRKAGGPK